jgi:hypothetical protein
MNKITIPKGISPDAALLLVGREFLFVGKTGKGITQKYLSPGAVRQAFAGEPMDSGWLPPNVRRWGTSAKGAWALAWYPPAMYSAWLPERKREVKIPMPALAFFGQGTSYYLWAFQETTFNPKAQLFNAPCANVSTGLGLICFGENSRPNVQTGEIDKTWRLFWDAPFSGSHIGGKDKKFKDINEKLSSMARLKATVYPADHLVPSEHRLLPKSPTLEAIVDLMVKRGGAEW